jgi:hypothetical protein
MLQPLAELLVARPALLDQAGKHRRSSHAALALQPNAVAGLLA